MKSGRYERFIFQPIEKGLLEIDSDGRIWRKAIAGVKRVFPCVRKRAEKFAFRGYYWINFLTDSIGRVDCPAHRAVYFYFKGEIPEGLTINHIDGCKTNNRPDNLEIATQTEQVNHAYRIGLLKAPVGEIHGSSKLTEEDVRKMRALRQDGRTYISIAKQFGMSPQSTWDACNRKTWGHVT